MEFTSQSWGQMVEYGAVAVGLFFLLIRVFLRG